MPRFFSPFLLAALAWAGCDGSRERPTGLGRPLPPTTVEVVQPPSESLVPVDSVIAVVVEATGLVTALEIVLTHAASRDTLALDRSVLDQPEENAQGIFELTVPRFETGTHLQFRAVAEDLVGGRHESRPVIVSVIECDVFPLACGSL